MADMRTSLQPPADAPTSSSSGCSTCVGASAATTANKVAPRQRHAAPPKAAPPKAAPPKPLAWVADHQEELKVALAAQKELLMAKKAELTINDETTKANLKKFFGSDSEQTRKKILARVDKEITLNNEIARNPSAYFRDAKGEDVNPDGFACVDADDKTHKIYINPQFYSAPVTGEDSRAGTLSHEMSHFKDIAGTDDKVYGLEDSVLLAEHKPADAMKNADSFEYYIEGSR